MKLFVVLLLLITTLVLRECREIDLGNGYSRLSYGSYSDSYSSFVFIDDYEKGYTMGYREKFYKSLNISVIETNINTVIDWKNSMEYWWDDQFFSLENNCTQYDFSRDIDTDDHILKPSILTSFDNNGFYEFFNFSEDYKTEILMKWDDDNSFICKVGIHAKRVYHLLKDTKCFKQYENDYDKIQYSDSSDDIVCKVDINSTITCPILLSNNTSTVYCEIPNDQPVKKTDLYRCDIPSSITYTYYVVDYTPAKLEIKGIDKNNQKVNINYNWADYQLIPNDDPSIFEMISNSCDISYSSLLQIPNISSYNRSSIDNINKEFPYYSSGNSKKFSLVTDGLLDGSDEFLEWIYESDQLQYLNVGTDERYILILNGDHSYYYSIDSLECFEQDILPLKNTTAIAMDILSQKEKYQWTFFNRSKYNGIDCDIWESKGKNNETLLFIFSVPEWQYPGRKLLNNTRIPLSIYINDIKFDIRLYLPITDDIPESLYSFNKDECFPKLYSVKDNYSALVDINLYDEGLKYSFFEAQNDMGLYVLLDKDKCYQSGKFKSLNDTTITPINSVGFISTLDYITSYLKDVLDGQTKYIGVEYLNGHQVGHWRRTSHYRKGFESVFLFNTNISISNAIIDYYWKRQIVSGKPQFIPYYTSVNITSSVNQNYFITYEWYQYRENSNVDISAPKICESISPGYNYQLYNTTGIIPKDKGQLASNKTLLSNIKIDEFPQHFSTYLQVESYKPKGIVETRFYKWDYNSDNLFESFQIYQDNGPITTYTYCYHNEMGGPSTLINDDGDTYLMGDKSSLLLKNSSQTNDLLNIIYSKNFIKKFNSIDNLVLSYNGYPAVGYKFKSSDINYQVIFYPNDWIFYSDYENKEINVPMVFKRSISRTEYEVWKFIDFQENQNNQLLIEKCHQYNHKNSKNENHRDKKSTYLSVGLICLVVCVGAILLTVSMGINRYHARNNITYINPNQQQDEENLESLDTDFDKFMKDDSPNIPFGEEYDDKLNLSTNQFILNENIDLENTNNPIDNSNNNNNNNNAILSSETTTTTKNTNNDNENENENIPLNQDL